MSAYQPPAHMDKGARGYQVASRLYAEACDRWMVDGRIVSHEGWAGVVLAVAGLHDGWLKVDDLEDVEVDELGPLVYDVAWPEQDKVRDLVGSAWAWLSWRYDAAQAGR